MPNVKMGADISSFKSGISQAKSEVKTLDQQMKMLDATMKAEGRSEQVLNQQTQTLNSRMAAQKNIANQAEAALKQMSKNGIDPASESYQKMARELLAAQTGMMETQAALNDLGNGAVAAAGGVEKLESGLSGIGKKISLDQVISGIDKITNGLENATRKAVNLGKSIFDNLMDAAMWADDTATMAMMYGIDLDTYQRMQKLVTNGMDTSVEAILKSQSKLKKGVGDGTTAVMDALRELGLLERNAGGKTGEIFEFVSKDSIDLFWEAGQAIKNLTDEAGNLKEYEQESMAQALFGKSWRELTDLFDKYKNAEEFEKALKGVDVNSNEAVQNLATLNDKMGELRGNFDTLSREILAQFAPGLIELSGSLSELLSGVMEYLKTDQGKEALKSMSDSFLGLFDGLRNISAEDVVNKFKEMLDSVVSGFKWIKDNGDTLLGVLGGIGAFWAGLKVSEGVLTLLKVIKGLKDLMGIGGENAAETTATKKTGFWKKTLNNMGAMFMSDNFDATDMFLLGAKSNDPNRSTQENIEAWQQSLVKNGLITQGKANKNLEIFKGLEAAVDVKPEVPDDAAASIADQIGTVQAQAKIEIKPEDLEPIDEQTMQLRMMEKIRNGNGLEVPVEPDVSADAAAQLAEKIGVVQVYADIVPLMNGYVQGASGGGGSGRPNVVMPKANGINFVPYDGYLALLHKGEQVVPARQVNSRNFTSNLYFENVNLNNGQDAEGLAARITAQQRREMSGYGSM